MNHYLQHESFSSLQPSPPEFHIFCLFNAKCSYFGIVTFFSFMEYDISTILHNRNMFIQTQTPEKNIEADAAAGHL